MHATRDEPAEAATDASSGSSKVLDLIDNAAWVSLAVGALWWFDVVRTVFSSIDTQREWLTVSIFLLVVACIIGLYCVVWLHKVKGIHPEQWEQNWPLMIPLATVCFALGFFCMVVATWPVYGFKSPVILFIICMGFVSFICLIPSTTRQTAHTASTLHKDKQM